MPSMAHSEPDIAELFAPLAPAQASSVVLSEARQVLAHLRQADRRRAVGVGHDRRPERARDRRRRRRAVMAELPAKSLVPAAERDRYARGPRPAAHPRSDRLARAAGGGGQRRAAGRRPGRARPGLGGGDRLAHGRQVLALQREGGRQESLTVSFGYGAAEHALSVLIDHGRGGKIKDAWVDDAQRPARQDLDGRGERPAHRLRGDQAPGGRGAPAPGPSRPASARASPTRLTT